LKRIPLVGDSLTELAASKIQQIIETGATGWVPPAFSRTSRNSRGAESLKRRFSDSWKIWPAYKGAGRNPQDEKQDKRDATREYLGERWLTSSKRNTLQKSIFTWSRIWYLKN